MSKLRVRWAAVALALAALAALAIAGPSSAVQPYTDIHVVNDITVVPSSGFVTFTDLGRADGVAGIQCDGESPVGGPVIPSQVVTDLRTNETVLRILRPSTTGSVSVHGVPVDISCVIESELGPFEALERRAG